MKPGELLREVAKGKLRPAYLLAGEEPLLRDEALAAVRGAVLDGAADDFNLDRLSGRGTSPDRLRDAARTLPVMAERRLVVLSEPAEGRSNASKELCDSLVEVVAELREQAQTVLLVVTAAKADKRSAWVKAFKDPAVLVDCAVPNGAKGLISFVNSEAKAQGLELEAGVAEMLAERIGPQLLLLRHELTKVSLLAGPGKPVKRSHVEASTNHIAEESIWDLMDAIGEGRLSNALLLLGRLEAKSAPPMILGSLAGHFRKLSRLHSGAVVPGPPFVVKKLQRQAQRFTRPRLIACLKAIHETDTALKGAGALPPEAALERLVIGLAS